MTAHPTRRPAFRKTRLSVRPLEERDIPQCEEIEREAFPTMFPRTSFRSEFRRPMASYFVATETAKGERNPRMTVSPHASGSIVGMVADKGRHLIRSFVGQYRDTPAEFLAGMLGIWYMAGDAHIVTVAVREGYRRKGIGEMLLINSLQQATAQCEGAATLEVRVSNIVAKSLYTKYGFKEKGIRKGYYSDNREDAAIMTTGRLRSEAYQERLRLLLEAYQRPWDLQAEQPA